MRALYLAQTGLSEPLAHSQVLPYLRGLVRRGWTFDVVALEPQGSDPAAVESLRAALRSDGIEYHPSHRSASHGRASKVAQMGRLVGMAASIAVRRGPRIVHARSDVAAVAAVTLGKLVPGLASIYDCRGFLADEYADFGHWSRDSLNYKGLRWSERRLYASADAVVTLTHSARRFLVEEAGWVPRTTPFEVVPCCVEPERFAQPPDVREAQRSALRVTDELVVVYAGTLGSWYCEAEMASLFARVARRRRARFLVLTRAPADRLRAALANEGVAPSDVTIRAASPEEMGPLLSAADVGISFAKPAFSKRASSPVKMGEYLAAGAGLVLNRGVGDADALCNDSACFDAGDLSGAALEAAAERIARTSFDVPFREGARALARAELDLESIGVARYDALYRRLTAA